MSTFSWSKSLCSRKCLNYSDCWTNWGRVKFSWQQWTPQETFLALGKVTGGQFVQGLMTESWCLPKENLSGLIAIQCWDLWSYFLHWFFPTAIHISGCSSWHLVHPECPCSSSREMALPHGFQQPGGAHGVFFLGCPWLQLLSSPSTWFCAGLVLSHCGLRQSCSSASLFCGAILRPLLFPKSSPRHYGLSVMPIHSPTAASGSVLGEFRVKMLQGWWVLLCRISTIIQGCKELVCVVFSPV